jgi:hypothetical protein
VSAKDIKIIGVGYTLFGVIEWEGETFFESDRVESTSSTCTWERVKAGVFE